MFFAIEKLANVEIAVGINFDALAVLLVVIEIAFVQAAVFAD